MSLDEAELVITRAVRRALSAKEREVRAHRRAAGMHDHAAELHAALGRPQEAALARGFAASERARLAVALDELQAMQDRLPHL